MAFILRIRLVGLLLIMVAILYVTVQMVLGIVLAVCWFLTRLSGPLRRLDHSHGDRVRSHHWTITLCHVIESRYLDGLLRATLERSVELADTNFRPDPADGTHVVMCFERAITTQESRAMIAKSPVVVGADAADSGIYVVRRGSHFDPPQPDAQRPIGFIALLLATATIMVAASAQFIAGRERLACTDAGICTGRPATWTSAALWLVSRMIPGQHSDVTPVTWEAKTYGYLMVPVAIVIVACIAEAIRRYARYQRKRAELMYKHIQRSIGAGMRILVLVALEVERDAVIQCVAAAGGRAEPEPDSVAEHALFRLGRLGSAEILLAQSEQGTVSSAAMTLTAHVLIESLRPDYVILAGICFGLWSRQHDDGAQEIGDLVISTHVQCIDHRKVTDDDGSGPVRIIPRGDRVPASGPLLSASRAATRGWSGPALHFGAVLSSNTLVDNDGLRQRLRTRYEEAAAGEMELAGVYAAVAKTRGDWIMIKGISDWGMGGMNDQARQQASMAAAGYIVHTLTYGGLSSRQTAVQQRDNANRP
jgi:nucleoside phosphorylase